MIGLCKDFCPERESKLRIKEKLLHFFEYKNGQKNVPGTLVKCFSRSAAGTKEPRPKDVRTEECLKLTIEYLFQNILVDKRKPFNIVYDFIFDRLRAVRQEIVMQDLNAQQTIRLLEPMIMFLAYCRYRLCEETIDHFDPKICEQHLQECLKRVLCCYNLIDPKELKLIELKRRSFVEALYQIFNLGSSVALSRCLTLSKDIRDDEIFLLAYYIALSYYQGQLYRVFNGIQRLPHVLCAIAAIKLQALRCKLYEIFSHAYNSKQLGLPVDFISRMAHLHNDQDVIEDCKHYNLKATADKKTIHFIKTDFDVNAPVRKERHENFVQSKLERIYLPEVLLLKKL